MKILVDELIVSKTKCCENNKDCLKNEEHIFCQVQYFCNNQVLFVKSVSAQKCHYKSSFGYSHSCHCPIRKEIYLKYGK